jgi:quercetin dioxygenase-like cupin family protein
MNTPCDVCDARDECLVGGKEYIAADNVFIKEMFMAKAGTFVPQHSHKYDHTSYVASGSVLCEGKEFHAPCPIFIQAGKRHNFVSLEDNTLVLCIHNIVRNGAVEIVV